MSPEQALGKPVDTRTDLFSFGILLYEMCTGRSPFPGDTTGELLIAIVQQVQVTPAQLNPDVPEGLARIIDRCLAKDRQLRYQHASEIRADLKRLQRSSAEVIDAPFVGSQQEPLGHPSSGSQTFERARGSTRLAPTTAQPKGVRPARQWRWGILIGLLIVAASLLIFYRSASSPTPELSEYTQLSHDGEAKFLAGTDGSRLYLGVGALTAPGIAQMSVSGGDPVRLAVPSAYTFPAGVSPDGTELLAIGRQGLEVEYPGSLWRLPTLNGPPRRIGNVLATDATWSARWQDVGLLQSRGLVCFGQRWNWTAEGGLAQRNCLCAPVLARWEQTSLHLAKCSRCKPFSLGGNGRGTAPSSSASRLASTIHRCRRQMDNGWEVLRVSGQWPDMGVAGQGGAFRASRRQTRPADLEPDAAGISSSQQGRQEALRSRVDITRNAVPL